MVDNNTKEMFRKAQNGDKQARDILITSNMKLVYEIAKKYLGKSSYESIVQEGMIGLIKSVDDFEADRELKFSTYAYIKIEGEMRRYIRDHREDRPFRPKRSEYLLYNRVLEARKVLSQEFGEEPKVFEVATYLQEDIAEVELLVNAMEKSKSIYSTVYANTKGQEDLDMLSMLEDDSNTTEEQIVDKLALMQSLETLTKKQKTVIELRYFKEYSQLRVGQALNISQAQICRIEKKALQTLKEVI